MVNFNSVKQDASKMLGMRYGSYETSVSNMNNVYKKGKVENYKTYAHTDTQEYLDKNNNKVALSVKCTSANKTIYTIQDYNTGRTYSTAWQDMNKASDEFTSITFANKTGCVYKVEDTNGNGIVDKDDMVKCSDYNNKKVETTSIKLSDLLNGNI